MAGLVDSPSDKAPILLPPRLLIAVLFLFANNLRAEDVLLTVNVKKPVAVTSDKFLSYTLDPTVALTGNAITKNIDRSTNMAKALAPAYVRIGGPRTRYSFVVGRSLRQHDKQDPNFAFTEADWTIVNHWAENAGLDVVACITSQHSDSGGRTLGWDLRNAMDLVSFSDSMEFNTSWQLGYESQKRGDVSGSDVGRDVIRLRAMLDAFPRYSNSVITGPDVVTCRSKQQQQYFQDYLNVAGTVLSAITWRPKLASITLEPEGVSFHNDNLALDREVLYKAGGRLVSKKPLWLVESRPEACKNQFLGALVWTRRLGNAAKLGIQVIMRQPNQGSFIQPTPDYWVSVLHKNLVGREVLDARIAAGNRTHVYFYCQCTKPSSKYEKGSMTVFGINLTPFKVSANIKGIKIKTAHAYILLPGYDAQNRKFSETVLLNNEPLHLINDREMPEMKPIISSNARGVDLKLPSGGIGFWVLPGLRIKSCGGFEEDVNEKIWLRRATKRPEDADSEEAAVHDDSREPDEDEDDEKSGSRKKRRRKHRYNDEEDAEKRYRTFEARMDLERIENLLGRRDGNVDQSWPRERKVYVGFDGNERGIMDNADEETVKEIKAKLRKYKKLLEQYESRHRKIEKTNDSVVEAHEGDTIDSDKVMEAMVLISKMENKMKTFGKIDDDVASQKWKLNDFQDVMSNHVSVNTSKKSEDLFLDELLKSKKILRTSVPSKIEDQLRGIYEMLAEEKARRQNNSSVVQKSEGNKNLDGVHRETDGRVGRARRQIDTTSTHQAPRSKRDGVCRILSKFGEAKQRLMERRRKRPKVGRPYPSNLRRSYDTKSNPFRGFQQREPLKNFPRSDVHMTTGASAEEKPKDYDYLTDDDDRRLHDRRLMSPRNSKTLKNSPEPDEAPWIEEGDDVYSYMPSELSEITRSADPRDRDDPNGPEPGNYGEVKIDRIVQEPPPDVYTDERTKEESIRRLDDYYNHPRTDNEEDGIDYMDPKSLGDARSYGRHQPIRPVAFRGGGMSAPVTGPHENPATSYERDEDTEYDSPDPTETGYSSMRRMIEDSRESGYREERSVSNPKRPIDYGERFYDRETTLRRSDENHGHGKRSKRGDVTISEQVRDIIANSTSEEIDDYAKESELAKICKPANADENKVGRPEESSDAVAKPDGKANFASTKNRQLVEGQRNSTKVDKIRSSLNKDPLNFGTINTLVKNNRDKIKSKLLQRGSKLAKVVGSADNGTTSAPEMKAVEGPNKRSDVHQIFPRGVRKKSKPVGEPVRANLTNPSPRTAEPDIDQRISPDSIDRGKKIADSSVTPTSGKDEVDVRTNGSNGHKNTEVLVVGSVKDVPENAQVPKDNLNADENSMATNPAKRKAKGDVTDRTSKGRKILPSSKDVVKVEKSPKESPKTSRKLFQRTKTSDSDKAVADRIEVKSEVPKKIPTSDASKAQLKRAEKIEKLRDRLRRNRAKMDQEHQTDSPKELVEASDVKTRNRTKRDIFDQIGNDGELGVDQQDVDHSMPDELIDDGGSELRMGKVERISPLDQIQSAIFDTTNNLREGFDATDGNVERSKRRLFRAGEPHYDFGDGLENTENHENPNEEFVEDFWPVGFDVGCMTFPLPKDTTAEDDALHPILDHGVEAEEEVGYPGDSYYVSKKKYNDLVYERSKYKSPKYVRLAAEKVESNTRSKSKNLRENAEYSEIGGLDRMKPELEAIDDPDLAKALDSDRFELSMTTPAHDQKRNRRKRQLPNKKFRYDVDSTINEISLDSIGVSKKEASEEIISENIPVADTAHRKASDRTRTVLQHSIDINKNAVGSDLETSMVSVARKLHPSTKEDAFRPKVPAFVQIFIPRSKATVIDEMSQKLGTSEPIEKIIAAFRDKFDGGKIKIDKENPISIASSKLKNDFPMTSNIFNSAVTKIKSFFNFLLGIVCSAGLN